MIFDPKMYIFFLENPISFFIYWVHAFMGRNLFTIDLIWRFTNGKFYKQVAQRATIAHLRASMS